MKKIIIHLILLFSFFFLNSCSLWFYIFGGSYNYVLTEDEINKKVSDCTKNFKISRYSYEWTIPIIYISLLDNSDRAEIYITLFGDKRFAPRIQCNIIATVTIDYRPNDCSLFLVESQLISSNCSSTGIDFIPDRLAEWVLEEYIIPRVEANPFKINYNGCDKFYVDNIICKDKKANITLKKVK